MFLKLHSYKLKAKMAALNLGLFPGMNERMHNQLMQKGPAHRTLVYHGVVPQKTLSQLGKKSGRFISTEMFEAQIRYFSENFKVIPLRTFVDASQTRKNQSDYLHDSGRQKLGLSITFDDGYENNFHYAAPVLKKYNVPAVFFVCTPEAADTIHPSVEMHTNDQNHRNDILWTDWLELAQLNGPAEIFFSGKSWRKGKWGEYWLGKEKLKEVCKTATIIEIFAMLQSIAGGESFRRQPQLEPFWKLMRPQQIKMLNDDPLFEIGSHGVSHLSLDKATAATTMQELKLSKAWLEQITKKEIDMFAFPFGHYTSAAAQLGLQDGYRSLFLADFLSSESDLLSSENSSQSNALFPRLGTNPYAGLQEQMYAIIKGGYA